jgi:LCP family protein required for cell wall assembly
MHTQKSVHINLIPEEDKIKKSPPLPNFSWRRLIAVIIILSALTLIIASSVIVFSAKYLGSSFQSLGFLGQMGKLITSNDRELAGEQYDRINIVLIGMGGANHDGGTLADTIIVGSLKPSTKKTAVMSIPRDLSVNADNRGWIKINAVHAYAEKDNPGSGGAAMSTLLSKLLGTEINYYVTIDFDGFEKLIDELGGVDIDVERDLIDYQYPIRGREDAQPYESRYEKLVIKQGPQHLDGATALKYARSRHALGAEGSDFARSKRQQKIMAAVKDKILSTDTFLNPRKINSLLSAYNDNVSTNLSIGAMLRLATIGKDVDTSKIISYSLTDGPTSLLRAQIINGAYMLVPKGGNYDKLALLWKNIFSTEVLTAVGADTGDNESWPTPTVIQTTSTKPATATTTQEADTPPPPATEKATIEIQNGTFTTGWAGREATALKSLGLNVIKTGNAPMRDYTIITIYDNSDSNYPETLEKLKKQYPAAQFSGKSPNSTASFLIILGQK